VRSRRDAFDIYPVQPLEVVENVRQLVAEPFDVFFGYPYPGEVGNVLYLVSRKGQDSSKLSFSRTSDGIPELK